MHLVLKSERMIFLRNLLDHKKVVNKFSKKFQIKILAMEFNGNHLHLVVRLFYRDSYTKFIRAVTSGMTAIAGLKNTFVLRPYTRFIQWGKDLKTSLSYLSINNLESDGINRPTARLLHGLLNEGFG